MSTGSTGSFPGLIDEIGIWNEVLTANEITALYNSGNILSLNSNSGNYTSSSGLQGYFNFNNGSGSTLTDQSSNSNNGTISGASWGTGNADRAAPTVTNVTSTTSDGTLKVGDVAAITTPDARTIQIQPWDKSTVAPIEKALIEAKLGINPIVTGELIRMPIPELSGERREELCKMAQGFAEQGRIGIRASRKEAMDALKLAQKDGMPEDDFKRSEKEVQKITDDSVGQINQALSSKEADLRQV